MDREIAPRLEYKMKGPSSMNPIQQFTASVESSHYEFRHNISELARKRLCKDAHLAVFRSVATSVFALFKTFWNSATRCLIRECMYAFEHLMW